MEGLPHHRLLRVVFCHRENLGLFRPVGCLICSSVPSSGQVRLLAPTDEFDGTTPSTQEVQDNGHSVDKNI